jgi:hypothetical protein
MVHVYVEYIIDKKTSYLYPHLPQTIKVKLAPFLATILWRWFGKFAMPVPIEAIGAGGTDSTGEAAAILWKQW